MNINIKLVVSKTRERLIGFMFKKNKDNDKIQLCNEKKLLFLNTLQEKY